MEDGDGHEGHSRARSRSPVMPKGGKNNKITNRRKPVGGSDVKIVKKDSLKGEKSDLLHGKEPTSKMAAELDEKMDVDMKKEIVSKCSNSNSNTDVDSQLENDFDKWQEIHSSKQDGKRTIQMEKFPWDETSAEIAWTDKLCDNLNVICTIASTNKGEPLINLNDDLNSDDNVKSNVKSNVSNVKAHTTDEINKGSKSTCDTDNKYVETDKGPFIVHLTSRSKTDKEIRLDVHDVEVGLMLKKLKVQGIKQITKITRKELKVCFTTKELANDFLKGTIPSGMGLTAFIPRYNISKTGIIFDIPAKFSDEYLKDNLESELPIIGIERCAKRKIENGIKTKEWIPANTVKLTFRGQSVPDEVTFGYSKRKVKPDVPKVVQCYNYMRFGHIRKYCKQQNLTCINCGTQHAVSRERPCTYPTKCFHCHSDKHIGTSSDCPEYLRNQLVKESMFYNNLTFSEANVLFPQTQSHYCLAEKQNEFPQLPTIRPRVQEERIEVSFPRKTQQELMKQYNDYINLNQGKKPIAAPIGPNPELYSKMVSTQGNKTEVSHTPQELNPNGEKLHREISPKKIKSNEAIDFIRDLSYKLGIAFVDPDQRTQDDLSNDVMLIDIGRMIMDFLRKTERSPVSYASSVEDLSQMN